MGKVRSLLIRAVLDTAQRAHKCQASKRHDIKRGDLRLNVRTGRGWDRYCMDCGRKIVEGSLTSLNTLSSAVATGKTFAVGEDDGVSDDDAG